MLVSRRERRADWPQPRGGFGSARVLGQSTRHMLSIAPVTAPGTKPTPRRSKNYGLRLGNGRFPYGAWIVVAVVVLLFPLDASANLAAEVPLSHWSYEALARLEAAGIVDPLSVASPGRASPIDRPLTRFELASATREALMFALALVIGERPESLEPHRTLLGAATALEHRLGRASAFYQELLKLARDEAGMPRDASLAGGLERFSGDLQAVETEARQIWSEIAPLLKIGGCGRRRQRSRGAHHCFAGAARKGAGGAYRSASRAPRCARDGGNAKTAGSRVCRGRRNLPRFLSGVAGKRLSFRKEADRSAAR